MYVLLYRRNLKLSYIGTLLGSSSKSLPTGRVLSHSSRDGEAAESVHAEANFSPVPPIAVERHFVRALSSKERYSDFK